MIYIHAREKHFFLFSDHGIEDEDYLFRLCESTRANGFLITAVEKSISYYHSR